MNFRVARHVMFPAIIVLMLLLPPGYSQQPEALIDVPFTLYEGKKGDPYTLYFPLELTAPGEINVYVRVRSIEPKPIVKDFEPLRVVLVDARAFKPMEQSQWKKFCVEVNQYNPVEWLAGDEIRGFVKGVLNLLGKGKKDKPPAYFHGEIACGMVGKGESIKHAVDSPEMKTTMGRYIVIVRNIEPFRTIGSILIRYPGETWQFDPAVERYAEVHADLLVEDMVVNDGGLLEVRLANRGKGAVREGHWHLPADSAATLVARVDGRDYRVPLAEFDPGRGLRRSGGTVSYVFNDIRITKASNVTVTIDAGNRILEENENNNSLTRQLGGMQIAPIGTRKTVAAAQGKPDLAVTSIRLGPGKVIEVIVQNVGKTGVDAAFWSGSRVPYLHLKMNGNSWATVPLTALDPQKNLSRPGGTAVHSTGHVLRHEAVIEATIDAAGLIDETETKNNTLQQQLRP